VYSTIVKTTSLVDLKLPVFVMDPDQDQAQSFLGDLDPDPDPT
jgi:hypothetical protein